MMVAQLPSFSITLVVLTFLTGFAIAALVFGLVLRRSRKRRASSRSPKHALGNGQATQATRGSASSTAISADRMEQPEQTQKDEQAAPTLAPVEYVDVPTLPTDLFELRYQAKFERTRRRLERLRTTLNEN